MPIPAFPALAVAASLACGIAHAQPASLVANAARYDVASHDVEPPAAPASRHGAAPVSFRFLHAEEGHEIALTDVHVVIVTPLGQPLFEAVSDGPFLLANVPFGRYEVIASHEGRSRRVALDVSRDDAMLVAIHW